MSISRLVFAFTLVVSAFSVLPATAGAAPCHSSTPASNVLYDAIGDAEDGLAPEVSALRVAIDGACNATFSYDVVGQAAPLYDDFFGWFVNVDNNIATGSPSGFLGADMAFGLAGSGGTILTQWNGSSFADVGTVSRTGAFAVSVPLPILAATPGLPMVVEGGASWLDYNDWAPEPGAAGLTIVPFFSSTPPPPPPPPPPSQQQSRGAGCVVPNVKGLKLSTARSRIRRAGCSVGATRKRVSRKLVGRVLRTSPGRGTRLAAGARVTIYLGKRAKRKGRRASASATGSPELAVARINTIHQRAAAGGR